MKGEIALFPYEMSTALDEAKGSFAQKYNYHCYHEVMRNVTQFDVYMGHCHKVLQRRNEVKERVLETRIIYDINSGSRALGSQVPIISETKMSHFYRQHTMQD